MPRVRTVKKAQQSKRTRRCHRCGHEIQPGESYRHWKFRTGGRGGRMVFACSKQGCSPKPSDLTQSPHLSAFYAAQESASEQISGWSPDVPPRGEEPTADDLTSILEEYAGSLREVGEGLTESADAIEEGFGHATYQVEELQERAQSYEDAADQVESWEPPAFDPPEDPDNRTCEECDTELQDGLVCQECGHENEDAWTPAVESFFEEARESAQSAVDEVECY